MTFEDLRRFVSPIYKLIANLAGPGVVRRSDDSKGAQSLQVALLDTETRDEVERFQNYGFTSRPLDGAEAAVVFMGGDRDQGIVIVVEDRRYRLKNLEKGEVAMFTDQGDKVVIKRGGTIEITASTKVKINAPVFEVNGDVRATGEVTAHFGSPGAAIALSTHTHAAGASLISPSGSVTGTTGGPL